MGIDVASAYARERELRDCASQLRGAKNKLEQYKGIFGSSWQGSEIPYYIQAIENVKRDIESAISEMESIGSDISSAAEQIRREEEEEERRRREQEERERREAEERVRQAVLQNVVMH